MSNGSLPYYQRVFYKSAADLQSKEPRYDLDKHCFYMLNVCERCGQPLSGGALPSRSGKHVFSIMTDTTAYMRHDPRHCDKMLCKRYIVGTYAEYDTRCCYCRGVS